MAVPASRYQMRQWPYPEALPGLSCEGCCWSRQRQNDQFAGMQDLRLSRLAGQDIALRPTTIDGVWEVGYAHFRIGSLDLRESSADTYKVLPRSPNVCY